MIVIGIAQEHRKPHRQREGEAVEELRTLPAAAVAVEHADLTGRLRTLMALGLIKPAEEEELYYEARKARQMAEED